MKGIIGGFGFLGWLVEFGKEFGFIGCDLGSVWNTIVKSYLKPQFN
jgi:hypothetical protein